MIEVRRRGGIQTLMGGRSAATWPATPSTSATRRGSILVATNLPFDEWTEVFGSERLTGALLDRLTHHVH